MSGIKDKKENTKRKARKFHLILICVKKKKKLQRPTDNKGRCACSRPLSTFCFRHSFNEIIKILKNDRYKMKNKQK